MSKTNLILGLLLFTSAMSFAESTRPVEVLYVAESRNLTTASLHTYNVDPETAAIRQIGPPATIPARSVNALSIGTRHLLYVWNSTDVWVYATNPNGLPAQEPFQHLTFDFAYPVNTFLVDPKVNFAYAAITWSDWLDAANAQIVLFTIDQSTGKLTNTHKIVATYGPNYYIPLTTFGFGVSGRKLFVTQDYSGAPFTCGGAYDYYPVDQRTGRLGNFTNSVGWGWDCGTGTGAAITDSLGASANACCGPGSGTVYIVRLSTGEAVACSGSMLSFCGDDASGLSLDPLGRNLFFRDGDLNQVFISHIDAATLQLLPSTSTILGTPLLYFSPDSRLVYALSGTEIGVYAFRSATGDILASSKLPLNGYASVSTATFHRH